MVRNNKSSHYYSVSEKVKIGKSNKKALTRELIGEIGDLAIVRESFFEYGVNKEKFH